MHLHLKSEIPLENIIRHNFTRVRTMFEIETMQSPQRYRPSSFAIAIAKRINE